MKFRTRIFALMLLAPLAAILVGAVSLLSEWKLQTVLNQNITLGVAIRNHVEMDMLHDGIRADALAALLASATQKGNPTQIREDLREHSEWFLRLLYENKALPLSDESHQAIDEVRPALENYVSQAKSLVEAAFTSGTNTDAALAEFETAFEDLEVRNEKVSDLLTGSLKTSQSALDTWLLLSNLLIAGIVVAMAIGGTWYGMQVIHKINVIVGGELEDVILHTYRMASGDLNAKVDIKPGDNTSMLAAMGQMRNNLIKIVRDTQTKLAAVVPQLTDTATRTRDDMRTQVEETTTVLMATQQLNEASDDVARSATQAADASQNANQQAQKGRNTVEEAIRSNRELSTHMANAADVVMKLDEGSRKITSIVEVIRTIAEQTNLLALNAAIEAARAGEQGRGFAVVADEVRTLAQRTQTATQEIGKIIASLADASQEAVHTMRTGENLAEASVANVNHLGGLLGTIVDSIGIIDSMNAQIAAASTEQNAVAQNISDRLKGLSGRASETSQAAEQTMGCVGEMNTVVEQLDWMINKRRKA